MRAISPKLLTVVAVLGGLLLPCRIVRAGTDEPPRFEVPSAGGGPLVFVAYGDTRFTPRVDVVNATARRALVEKIASEKPAARTRTCVTAVVPGRLEEPNPEPRDCPMRNCVSKTRFFEPPGNDAWPMSLLVIASES